MPAALNAANEIAVEAFLSGHLPFSEIRGVNGSVMRAHAARPVATLQDVLDADAWARDEARETARRLQAPGTRAGPGANQLMLVLLNVLWTS